MHFTPNNKAKRMNPNVNEHEVAEKIHNAAMALLKDPGIRLDHDEICKGLLDAGAQKGVSADVIRFPKELVAEKLALCPREFVFADKEGNGRPVSAKSDAVIWSVPGLKMYENNAIRPFTKDDMARVARLLDQLENVDGVFGFALDDVPPRARDVAGLRIMAENTKKHIRVLCFTPQGSDMMVEMKKVVGEYPWFSVGFTAHGPLRWTNLALEIFKRSAGHGIPTTINGEPMAGVSGPVTLAGSAAVGTAEILAGIVINQILEPGRPCVFNLGLAHTFDMRTSIAVTGGPENHLFAQMAAMMGRFYNLPSASWVSTESMCPDAQTAMEKTCGFMAHLQSRVSNIWSVGQLESELTFSPAQAVIDDEIIAYVKRYLQGVSVNEEALALELIKQVGISGSFLEQPHTADHFRTELFMPKLLFRQPREEWESQGSKDLANRAEERAQALMQNTVDSKLTDDQIKELDALANRFLKQIIEKD
jgi:trimethylamine--corrinoid protein Co-methyltransferase